LTINKCLKVGGGGSLTIAPYFLLYACKVDSCSNPCCIAVKASFAFGWGFLSGCSASTMRLQPQKNQCIYHAKFLYVEDFSDFVPIVPYIYHAKFLYIEDFSDFVPIVPYIYHAKFLYIEDFSDFVPIVPPHCVWV
jgi:hypothetical protein